MHLQIHFESPPSRSWIRGIFVMYQKRRGIGQNHVRITPSRIIVTTFPISRTLINMQRGTVRRCMSRYLSTGTAPNRLGTFVSASALPLLRPSPTNAPKSITVPSPFQTNFCRYCGFFYFIYINIFFGGIEKPHHVAPSTHESRLALFNGCRPRRRAYSRRYGANGGCYSSVKKQMLRGHCSVESSYSLQDSVGWSRSALQVCPYPILSLPRTVTISRYVCAIQCNLGELAWQSCFIT